MRPRLFAAGNRRDRRTRLRTEAGLTTRLRLFAAEISHPATSRRSHRGYPLSTRPRLFAAESLPLAQLVVLRSTARFIEAAAFRRGTGPVADVWGRQRAGACRFKRGAAALRRGNPSGAPSGRRGRSRSSRFNEGARLFAAEITPTRTLRSSGPAPTRLREEAAALRRGNRPPYLSFCTRLRFHRGRELFAAEIAKLPESARLFAGLGLSHPRHEQAASGLRARTAGNPPDTPPPCTRIAKFSRGRSSSPRKSRESIQE